MPVISIVFGIILILQGIITYFMAELDHRSLTALIPAIFGVLLFICGFIATKPNLRKHAMHAAAVVALVGVLGALGRAIPGIMAGKAIGLAIGSQLFMGVLLIIYIILCVRSFIAARKNRIAAAE